MAPPKGHKFWKNRTKHGRDKLFSDAATLLDAAYEYFDWCKYNPRYKTELVKYQGLADEQDVPVGRPFLIKGLTNYLGVSEGYFRAAKANLRKKIDEGRASEAEVELLDAYELIEGIVYQDQVEGAMTGEYSPILTARINGLAETTNVKTDQTVVSVSVRDAETAAYLKELEDLL